MASKNYVNIEIDKLVSSPKKRVKKHVDIEIDKLTNSIENAITGESFETGFSRVTNSREIKKSDWLFDWHKELKEKHNEVYKLVAVENSHII